MNENNPQEILKDILLKMNYDLSKSLNENIQTILEQGSADINIDRLNKSQIAQGAEPESPKQMRPGEVKIENEFMQVPGHFPVATPFNGYIFIPNESKYSLFNGSENLTKLYSYENVPKKPTEEKLKSILKVGTLKSFTVPSGERYWFIPLLGKEFGDLKYGGYRTLDGSQYQTPKVEDVRTDWQKFVDNYGTPMQLIGSILIGILGTIATEGFGASASWAMFFEIIGEIGLNVPVAIRELEKGENIGASMSFLFASLPLIKSAAGLGKISDDMAKSLSEKLAKENITTVEQMNSFINSTKLTKDEKLALNVVLSQDPKNLAKVTKETLNKEIVNYIKINRKNLLGKLPLTSREWAKSLGVDLITILPLMTYKITYGEGLTPEQARKLNGFILSFPKESQEQVVIQMVNNPELIQKVITNPEETKKFIENSLKPKFDTGVEMTVKQSDSAALSGLEFINKNLDAILSGEINAEK